MKVKIRNFGHKLAEVGNTMLTNHREIMTKMLGTMKYEMTLVHSTDENRGKVMEYVKELEKLQENKLLMIKTLLQGIIFFPPDNYIAKKHFVTDSFSIPYAQDIATFRSIQMKVKHANQHTFQESPSSCDNFEGLRESWLLIVCFYDSRCYKEESYGKSSRFWQH